MKPPRQQADRLVRRSGAKSGKRRATATLEFALCLPACMVVFLGTLDCCSMVFHRQSLSLAVYEGSNVAIQPGAKTADVVSQCTKFLAARGIAPATVVTVPAEISTAESGTLVEVHVMVPNASVSLLQRS